jgi:hypothetical protein
MNLTNISTPAYHRNGIAGEPFKVCTFTMQENDEPARRMVAIRFENDNSNGWTNPRIAVFDLDLLAQGKIEFTVNSWRGDRFVDELDLHFFPQEANHAPV